MSIASSLAHGPLYITTILLIFALRTDVCSSASSHTRVVSLLNTSLTTTSASVTNEVRARKLYAPSGEMLHHWITGEKPQRSDTRESPALHPVYAQWILLHVGYRRTDFAIHRIPWVKSLLATVYSLLAVIGLVSNLTVIYILLIRRRRALANITNVFVLVLAISDVTLCGFNMPLQAYYELEETVGNNSTACKIIFTVFGIPMHVSCLTILMIACDRYQIIIYPLHPRMSTRLALFIIAIICLLSTLNSLPIALYTTSSEAVAPLHSTVSYLDNHTYTGQHANSYCVEVWPSETGRLIYSVITFLVHFLIPLCLTMGLYGHIFFRLHESRFRRSSVERKRRTNKILVRIVVCFAVCWTPWCCFCLWVEVHAYLWQVGALNSTAALRSPGDFDFMNHTSLNVDHVGAVYPTSARNMEHFEWMNRIVSHKARTYLDREMNRVRWDEPNSTNPPVSASGLDEASLATLTGDVPIANQDTYSTMLSATYDNKIKLIDMILKFFALGSGCINPWLYGWLNKFLVTLSKLYWAKFTRAMRLGKKFREWNARWQRNKRLSHSHGTADHADGHLADGETRLSHSKKHNDAVVQVCYCCGNLCKFNFVFSRSVLFHGKKQDHLSFLSSAGMNGTSQRGSHREGSHRDSQRNANESCERCAATTGRSGTGSRTSQSGSGRQKGSKCSADNMSPNVAAQLAEFEACLENAQQEIQIAQNRRDRECQQCNSYKRFGRRYSSRLSASSVGTVSYLDPSTKQTSLLPSSGFTPTPRGSFLKPGDPTSSSRLEPPSPVLNYWNLPQNKLAGNNLLVPPVAGPAIRGRSIDSGTGYPEVAPLTNCAIQINEERSQFSHSCPESEAESENPVITLLCPPRIPQPELYQIKTELITLHEQSDSTSAEQGQNQSSSQSTHHHEIVQINVHACELYNTAPSSTREDNTAPVLEFEKPQTYVTNVSSNIWLGPGLQAEEPEPHGSFFAAAAREIPFVDEEEEEELMTGTFMFSPLSEPQKDSAESQVLRNPYAYDEEELSSSDLLPVVQRSGSDGQTRKAVEVPLISTQIINEEEDEGNDNEQDRAYQPTQRRDFRRRLSFYPGFMLRRKEGHRDEERVFDGGFRIRQTIRRLSHREPMDNQRKLKPPKMPVTEESKGWPMEESQLGGPSTLGFDESSDADDFTHIGRIVALEEIRKQQARNRAMSVGSMPPASHAPKKTRQSLSQVPVETGTVHASTKAKDHLP